MSPAHAPLKFLFALAPRLLVAGSLVVFGAPACADNTAQALPFSQNWSNTGLITANDNWSGVPGIEGFLGQDITTTTGTDPQTLLGVSALANDLDVIANQTNPNTLTQGGVAEFQIADPVVALQGSGTADAPYLLLHLATTGQQTIVVSYNLRDIDGSTDNSTQQVALQYRVGSSGNFTNLALGYVADATTGPSAATLVTPISVTLPAAADNQSLVQVRVMTTNAPGNDEWVGIDDISVTGSPLSIPTLSIDDVTVAEGNAGPTTATFTVSVTPPLATGDITFDIGTADGTATIANNDYVAHSLNGQTIPANSPSYTFDVTVNGDTAFEPNETFFVNLTNITATGPAVPNVADSQGQGTITNDDLQIVLIHDVQGPGASSPVVGSTVTVEGIVVGDFQATGTGDLRGFFLQEEDTDVDADPATSEGIFVYCNACATPVAEGQRVRATGTVSEFFGMTEISATAAGSVLVTDAGNHLAEATPAPIDLPVVTPSIDDTYEPVEGMRVTFVDALTVAEYFEQARYGTIELFEGGRPGQFTSIAAPSVAGYAAHLDALARRRVILDDDDDAQNVPLALADGFQFVFHPVANGGLSVGTQGVDFFRGGDLVTGLTGVLHWSFSGLSGTDAWRIRPTAATPAAFTVANPRPAAPPAVGGSIRAASVNLLNYFTTIDTTASSTSGPCGPDGLQDCRGADSVAELNRQRERASIVLCGLDVDVAGLVELENTTPADTITDLLGAVNARCGGAHPYAFVSTGGTLGTDAIRVALIYRTGVLSPVGAPFVDLDPIHNRPPTAQTFDVVDVANPAFGQRFTVVANHFKSKGCADATGSDLDQNDGQGCYNARRSAQAARLLTWLAGTVVPAAGDPDLLLLGDFNSYSEEDPIATLAGGGFTDLLTSLLGTAGYSYLFDGQLGHLDYALASAGLAAEVTGIAPWHINADENPLFDYNDEVKDVGESAFEEKPDGSALVPPRVVFQPASPYRASDHDPVRVGLFPIADLSITKVEDTDPVVAGTPLTYTLTVANAGPNAAAAASWSDTLPAGTTFVSLAGAGGWSCTTPTVGSTGTVSCATPLFAVGSAVFTLTVAVDAALPSGLVLSNTATVDAATGDPAAANDAATATTTVTALADLAVAKAASGGTATAGLDFGYTLTVTNAGPSVAAGVTVGDPLPAGTTFVALAAPAGWSCTTPPVGSGGNVSCTTATLVSGPAAFSVTVHVGAGVTAGSTLTNTASVSAATSDPAPGNNAATVVTPVVAPAALSATKSVAGDLTPGGTIFYTLVLTNAGPADQSDNAGDELVDSVPTGLILVGATATSGTAAADPGTNLVTWNGVVPAGGSVTITIEARIPDDVEHGATFSNQAVVNFDGDGDGSNESSAVSDDPATPDAADPTVFQIFRELLEIPTLGGPGLAALALLLAGFAALRLRRARVDRRS